MFLVGRGFKPRRLRPARLPVRKAYASKIKRDLRHRIRPYLLSRYKPTLSLSKTLGFTYADIELKDKLGIYGFHPLFNQFLPPYFLGPQSEPYPIFLSSAPCNERKAQLMRFLGGANRWQYPVLFDPASLS